MNVSSPALLTAVVGFALQGVLGNLLGGMSLHLTRSVVPGDWVRVGEEEGRVIETNWRETRLRTLGGHTIGEPRHLVQRFERDKLDKLVEELRQKDEAFWATWTPRS